MKKVLAVLLLCTPLLAIAQKSSPSKYKEGAVPVVNGTVIFEKTYNVKGKNQEQIYNALQAFVTKLAEEENQLPQSRLTQTDKNNGTIVASMEEWLYFKKKAWVTDKTRLFYQLVFKCKNESFTVEMRNIRYLYEEDQANGGYQMRAEEWITDEHAINKKKKTFYKKNGKFRTATIDRKNEVFDDAYTAVSGKKRIKKVIEVEVENED